MLQVQKSNSHMVQVLGCEENVPQLEMVEAQRISRAL